MSAPKEELSSTISSLSQDKLVKAREAVQKEVDSGKPAEPKSDDEPAKSEEFVADLNNVADVLVILVGRYQRAHRMMLACVGLLIVCLGFLVLDMTKLTHLQREVATLQGRLGDTQKEVQATTDQVKATKDEVTATKDEVRATKDEVKEAAAAAPKIEVDEKGKATVVLPVTKKAPSGCKSKDCPEPPKAPTSDAPQQPAPPTAPLDPQLQFR